MVLSMAIEPDQTIIPLDVFRVADDGSLVEIRPDDRRNNTRPEEPTETVPFRATPGPRLGLAIDRSARRGEREEVAQPVGVRPAMARKAALTSDLFATPAGGLTVDSASRILDEAGITWRATLRTGRWRRKRAASLHLHPVPSDNVAIVELMPVRGRRLRTRRFVTAGVDAVDDVARRIRQEVDRIGDSSS